MLCNIIKETSQLTGKAYEDSDCTIEIVVMHWLKRTIIVQKLSLVVEFWALLSSRWLPLLIGSCDVTYVAMHALGHNNDAANAIVHVNECMAQLFSVWKLQIQPVTNLRKSPVSYWWPTASCCSSRESCELLKQHCFDKSVYVSINLSIYWQLSI